MSLIRRGQSSRSFVPDGTLSGVDAMAAALKRWAIVI